MYPQYFPEKEYYELLDLKFKQARKIAESVLQEDWQKRSMSKGMMLIIVNHWAFDLLLPKNLFKKGVEKAHAAQGLKIGDKLSQKEFENFLQTMSELFNLPISIIKNRLEELAVIN